MGFTITYDFRNVAYTVIELDPITQKGGGRLAEKKNYNLIDIKPIQLYSFAEFSSCVYYRRSIS